MTEKDKNAGELTELEQIRRLGSSPYFLKLADSILSSLDRETLAELMAAYFYLKSKGRVDSEIANFIITRKTMKVTYLGLNALLSCIPWLIFDAEFRRLIFQYLSNSIRSKASSAK